MLPSQGDRITAIDDRVYCGVVDKGDDGLAPGYFRWHPFGDGSGTNRAYREDTEGLSWIRGWHGDGSEELNALLAANKLQASALFSASVHFTVGGSGMMAKRYEPMPNPAFDFDPLG